ncbi:jerky protein homolog-like [Chrysoperla carnea]|uniref:jerky protein homolog-like n=1 Tax=Chrysoperla carnea TaxID=189513 RepID=UPI001D07CEFD|nr:jerky protein homolog-like [Chrysoperla carnea]
MSSKRKHKTLLLKDKIDILMKLDSGENISKLAKEYGVGRATLHDLKKNKQKIVEHVKAMESGPGNRKTLREGNCPKMENALYMWFMQQRSKHSPISGEILKAKAIEFYKNITQKDDFRASVGWFNKFKKRFGIRLLTVSGENPSSDGSAVQPFTPNLKEVNELSLLPDQIYNADDSEVFLRLLPNKKFLSSKEASSEETQQMVIAEEICEVVLEDETPVEILGPPTTAIAKIKPNTAFNCFNTCIKWAEENGVSANDIIILRKLREKVFQQELKVA